MRARGSMRLDAPRAGDASERILKAGAIVAAVGGILLVLATLANQFVIAPDVSSIDGRVEHSVWTWASSAATFAGAFVARVWLVVSPRQRLNAVAIVATLAYFSLDDMLELHEEVGSDVAERLALPDWVGGLWLLAYPPLLLIAVWALVGATWNDGARCWPGSLCSAPGSCSSFSASRPSAFSSTGMRCPLKPAMSN